MNFCSICGRELGKRSSCPKHGSSIRKIETEKARLFQKRNNRLKAISVLSTLFLLTLTGGVFYLVTADKYVCAVTTLEPSLTNPPSLESGEFESNGSVVYSSCVEKSQVSDPTNTFKVAICKDRLEAAPNKDDLTPNEPDWNYWVSTPEGQRSESLDWSASPVGVGCTYDSTRTKGFNTSTEFAYNEHGDRFIVSSKMSEGFMAVTNVFSSQTQLSSLEPEFSQGSLIFTTTKTTPKGEGDVTSTSLDSWLKIESHYCESKSNLKARNSKRGAYLDRFVNGRWKQFPSRYVVEEYTCGSESGGAIYQLYLDFGQLSSLGVGECHKFRLRLTRAEDSNFIYSSSNSNAFCVSVWASK